MDIGGQLRSYFQLIGVLYLWSETAWMMVALLLGVLAAFCWLIWQLACLTF